MLDPDELVDDEFVTTEVSTLLRAGLPLDRSLQVLLDLSENDRIKRTVAEIRDDEVALLNGLAAELRAGASLRVALVAGADALLDAVIA